jgi:glycosyltransferase 2 family protein
MGGLSKFLARTAVSIGLMVWLLLKIDASQIGNQWQNINWPLLLLVIPPTHLVSIGLKSLRLKVILRGMGLRLSAGWLSVAQLRGLFVGAILPGGISGDVYRSYLVSQRTGQAPESVAAVLLEKCIGVWSMLFMLIVGLFWGTVFVRHPLFIDLERSLRFIWSGLLLGGVVLVAIVYIWRTRTTRMWFRNETEVGSFLRQVSGAFSNSRDVFELAIYSVLIQFAVVAWYFAISIAMRFDTSLLVLMLTVPIIEFLLMLPISISGIGVREVAFTVLLAPFGLPVVDAVSFSLLTFLVSTVTRALCGAAFLLKPRMQVGHTHHA